MNGFHRFLLKCFNVIYPSKIYGKENVPEGSAIIVCNHYKAIDCAFVARVYNKDVFFLAKKEAFRKKISGKILKNLGAIPVDRGNQDLKSFFSCLNVLKNGHKLVIFPEGTRNKSKDGSLQEIKSGTAVLSVMAKCPIIPVMIYKKAKIFGITRIMVGPPFEFSEHYGKKLSDEDISRLDDVIREKMIAEHVKLKKRFDKKSKKDKNVDN